jgi:hypothetical protein
MSIVATLPVITRIEAELFARLQRLAAEFSDVIKISEVVLPKRLSGYTPKDRQIVLTRETEERVPELDCPGNPPSVAKRQTFAIRCHVLPSEKDPTPVDQYCDIIASEVKRVVVDASRWWTFGEIACNSEWLPDEPVNSDGSFDGIAVMLAVTYKTDEGNPYNVRA